MVERYKKWMPTTKLVMVALLAGAITPSKIFAQGACPGLSNSKCRAEASGGGQLLHKPNGNGDPVWTAACGHNVSKPRLDPICQRIATCKAAGAYGGFLYAVTESCRSKHFDDYFGLDGLTFGIAHWTQNNLPKVLHVYQARSKDQYEKIFGALNIPINNGCVSAQWVCEANKQGRLACAPNIRDAFFEAMKDPEFVKAEIDVSIGEYEERLKRYSRLGLKSEYGNVAMIVVANNLPGGSKCDPFSWKASCSGAKSEKSLVDCMLDKFRENRCRGGSQQAVLDRWGAIKDTYKGREETPLQPISASGVRSCLAIE